MELELIGDTYPGFLYRRQPRNVYWETTISCDLACQHCRASAIPHRDPGELTTEQGKCIDEARGEVRRMIENVEHATGVTTLMCGYTLEDIATDINNDKIVVNFYLIKDTYLSILEDTEWDDNEFRNNGLDKFLQNYLGFN